MHPSGSKNSRVVRPTTDKVRLAIFSMLYHDIHGARVLDLFAGSGSLGLESVSRGAQSAVFVDTNTSLVEHNISKMRGALPFGSVSVVRGDIFSLRRFSDSRLRNTASVYDIIFVDPPYGEYSSSDVFQIIKRYGLLASDGVVVYEESSRSEFTVPAGFEVLKDRKYGDTVVRFVRLVDISSSSCFGAFLRSRSRSRS